MHRVRDVMSPNIYYLPREANIRAAVELMRSRQVEAVPVVEEGRVIGVLDALTVSLYDGEVAVEEAIRESPITVEADAPLAQAAREMRTHRLREVPVVEGGRLVGMLSDRDILNVWGMVTDVLTELPVQHQLRHWVAMNLARGYEVAILFLDLNDFGALNKKYSHLYGDQVLRRVAEVLRETIDRQQDFVCRYGGDEFAIGTIRRPASARELAMRIRERIEQISIEGRPAGISAAIGLSGGRRLGARSEAHLDAMLDDLITRASTASTTAKATRELIHAYESNGELRAEEETRPPGEERVVSTGRVVLERCHVEQDTGEAVEVSLALRRGRQVQEKHYVAPAGQVLRVLAVATAECLRELVGHPVEVEVEETYEFTTPRGLSCVGATVALTRDRNGEVVERLVGAAVLRSDIYTTYVNAILDATNRRLIGG